jgi:ComF family protein
MALPPFLHRLLDLLLPPLCLMCDEPVGEAATLCPSCWKQVQFVGRPLCECCGAPFEIPVEIGTLCGACLEQRLHFQAARAAMLYDDKSRKLVLNFKHGDRTDAAKALARWMHRCAADILAGADALVPVPLHRWRLFKRRYNQSALLAHQLGVMADKPVLFEALRRLRATPQQGHLKRKERQKNVKGAFAVLPKDMASIAGKVLVLVDDVMTTGATVDECSHVLLKAGAKEVRVLTLSRVKSLV